MAGISQAARQGSRPLVRTRALSRRCTSRIGQTRRLTFQRRSVPVTTTSAPTVPRIAKAIKSGRISAVRAEDGSHCIRAELHRVYPMTGQPTANGLQSDTPADTGSADTGLRGELDKWRALAVEREETIRDLRARFDSESRNGGAC